MRRAKCATTRLLFFAGSKPVPDQSLVCRCTRTYSISLREIIAKPPEIPSSFMELGVAVAFFCLRSIRRKLCMSHLLPVAGEDKSIGALFHRKIWLRFKRMPVTRAEG